MNYIEITKTGICYNESIRGTNNYLQTKIENIWSYLRKPCVIADGTTWEDLLEIILKNNSLKYFVEKCYPHYLFISPLNVVSKNVIIKKHKIKINLVLSTYSPDKPLILKNEIKIKNNDKTPLPASIQWNLLEILDILFSDAKSNFYCSLSHIGLFDEYNSLIPPDDQIACLMSECSISENTTMRDIFRFVSNNKILEDFMSKYLSCDISILHKAAINLKNLSDFTHLQISSYGILFDRKFYIENKFCGMSHLTETNVCDLLYECNALSGVIHLPIILNNKFVIRFTNGKIFAGCFKNFTLLDILYVIYRSSQEK